MADGKTTAEAVENAKVVIGEWIEYAKAVVGVHASLGELNLIVY